MKTSFAIAVLIISATLLLTTSCKKSGNNLYTCSCTYIGSSAGTDTTVKNIYPVGTTQSMAATDCSQAETSYKLIDTAAKCVL